MEAMIHSGQRKLASRHSAEDLTAALARGLRLLADRYRLNPQLLARYQTTIEHCLSSVAGNVTAAAANTVQDQPWGWEPCLDSPELSVGLLTVLSGRDIPLHDHPGSSGLLLVLGGKVRIDQYRMAREADSTSNSPLALERSSQQERVAGQYSHFGPTENNIHTLQAVGGDCLLFDVLFSPYQIQQRSFYMPIAAQSASETLYVTRLNKFRGTAIH